MSMLKYFFEYGCVDALFDGLAIGEEKELCREYMGRFPVISITLKGAVAGNYEAARAMLCSVIGQEAMWFSFLENSSRLTDREKKQYGQLVNIDTSGQRGFLMPDEVWENSLLILSGLLRKHYDQKVILLIDKYDVPMDKAHQSGYYDEMLSMVRNLLGQALKSNESIQFAVLTGCLRITKENVFTGLNNLKIWTITDNQFDRDFGFSDEEVRELLEFCGFENRYDQIKE